MTYIMKLESRIMKTLASVIVGIVLCHKKAYFSLPFQHKSQALTFTVKA